MTYRTFTQHHANRSFYIHPIVSFSSGANRGFLLSSKVKNTFDTSHQKRITLSEGSGALPHRLQTVPQYSFIMKCLEDGAIALSPSHSTEF
jgi:hypothetical protein